MQWEMEEYKALVDRDTNDVVIALITRKPSMGYCQGNTQLVRGGHARDKYCNLERRREGDGEDKEVRGKVIWRLQYCCLFIERAYHPGTMTQGSWYPILFICWIII